MGTALVACTQGVQDSFPGRRFAAHCVRAKCFADLLSRSCGRPDAQRVDTGATGSADRRGLCLAPHGTGNETRQVLTWGDAPYPSAAQSKLLISGKAPLFAYPIKVIEAAACSPLPVKLLHPFIKLVADVLVRWSHRICSPGV